ncbi:unnamed protein product [Rangifer tarandus platyrhynchus]|uniref:Uncharacterized protein n=1 Tax=Rangifer tarandus platyrhynchus TaxID=3082113 RepID=A0AC59Y438_RANTA
MVFPKLPVGSGGWSALGYPVLTRLVECREQAPPAGEAGSPTCPRDAPPGHLDPVRSVSGPGSTTVCAEAPGTPPNRPVHPDQEPETFLVQPHPGHSKPQGLSGPRSLLPFLDSGRLLHVCVSPGLRTLVALLWDLLSG